MSTDCIINDFYQGDTPSWGVNVYTTTAKDVVVDTTGWKAWATFKSDQDLTDAEAEMQVTGIATSADGALGLISIKPTIEKSNALEAGRYFCDFQVLTDAGVIQTLESKKVNVNTATTISSS